MQERRRGGRGDKHRRGGARHDDRTRPPPRTAPLLCGRSRRRCVTWRRTSRAWLDGSAPAAAQAARPRAALGGLARRPAPPGRRPRRGAAAAGHHAHGRHRRRQIDAAQRPGRRRHRPGVVHPADHARPGRLLPRVGPPDRLDPALRHCRLVAARPAGAGAQDPRRYARPRQQRPGQPREADAPPAGRRRRALRRLAGEVPRPARLGAVPASSGSGGRSRSC